MHLFTKWIAGSLVRAGLMFAGDTPTAEAGNGFFRIGGGGVQLSIGGNRQYSHGYQSYRPSYGYNSYRPSYGVGIGSHSSNFGHGYSGGYYHDTSHYDYHPTEIIRHGNHYDVQPGHYDLHQTGHYHH